MESLILTIDFVIVGIFMVLLIMLSIDKAREEKIRGKNNAQQSKVVRLDKIA